MTPRFAHLAPAIAAVLAVATSSAAQPRIVNGHVTTRPAGPLTQTVGSLVASASDATWIGYSVPAVEGDRVICCGDGHGTWIDGTMMSSGGGNCCGACRLEPSGEGTSISTRSGTAAGPVRLEASDRLVVLFRVQSRQVERVRIFSEDCELDAGGRPVVWLQDVRPAESIALLESQVAAASGTDQRGRVRDGAIAAIAMHGDAAANTSLDRLAAQNQPEAVRRKVTFWLGNARGRHGLETLRRILRDDPSDAVRKAAVFGVSQSREPDAFDTLAGLARADASSRIRSEALFWIAQTSNPKASAVILDALDKDQAPEVRKKAVFALSQLKDDAGVESLVRVARTHGDASVRGEAIFWLGQKAGTKASAAITERIEQDPDTQVKKKAVFALSQLPASEGVPLLINVARTNTNPAVRKQAMFWLGQSKDPRAIDFFAEVLGK